MPAEGPGQRFSCTATKATQHGWPAVELNHPGIASKSTQNAPAAPSQANAEAAEKIAIGEEMVIKMAGLESFPSSKLPGGAKAGDRLAIKVSDNSLVIVKAEAASNKAIEEGTLVKFGVLDSIDTTAGLAWVNFNLRSAF